MATRSVIPPPAEWEGELRVLEIAGVPEMRDTALLHIPSRTLILTELLFNFDSELIWTELILRAAAGSERHPGLSRPYKAAVKDEAAFKESMETILSWDFDRIVVRHGNVIELGGKSRLRDAIAAAGFVRTVLRF